MESGNAAKVGGSSISAKRRKVLASWNLGYQQGCGNKVKGWSGEHEGPRG